MLMTCAPGTMFDTKTLSCNHMTKVSCSTKAASTMKNACKDNFGVYQNPVDPTCSTFIQCSWSEPYVRDCNPGLLFNPKSTICDFPSNVDCNVRLPKLSQEIKILNPDPGQLNNEYKPKLVCYYPNYAYWRKGESFIK